MNRLIIVLIAFLGAPAWGHSITPAQIKAIFINGKAVVSFESSNALGYASEFEVEIYSDNKVQHPYEGEFKARPSRFWLQDDDKRMVRISIKDDERISKRLWVCTASLPQNEGIELKTRICSHVKFYRVSRPND